MISHIAGGDPVQWGPMLIKDNKIFGPGGTMLHYETLQYHLPEITEDLPEFEREGYWRYQTRNGWTKLYSGKLVENVIQALARLHVSQAWLRCRSAGIHVVSMEHDKLIACVAASEAEDALAYMKQEMSREPVWLPGIPLDSEGYVSETFAK
jgi:hypothetical protein